MVNQTQENIKRKRIIKKRRRRVKFFRLLVFLLLASLVVAAVSWIGFQLYSWGRQTYDTYASLYQGYEQRQALKRSTLDPRFDDYTNVLLMGVDDGEDGGLAKRADTILLLSFNNTDGQVRFISIPRDTLAEIPGRKEPDRINATYAYGGPTLTMQTVSRLLGVSIHQYVALDTKALAEIVDTLGGMEVYVEQDMDYEDPEAQLTIHIVKGYQHMDGDTAQKYLRYRGGELGDIGRLQRQQHFVKAFYESLLQPDTVTRLPALEEICRNRITTSAELFDTAHLTVVLRKLSTNEPQVIMLPGAESQADPTLWLPDQEKIAAKVEELFPLPAEEP